MCLGEMADGMFSAVMCSVSQRQLSIAVEEGRPQFRPSLPNPVPTPDSFDALARNMVKLNRCSWCKNWTASLKKCSRCGNVLSVPSRLAACVGFPCPDCCHTI